MTSERDVRWWLVVVLAGAVVLTACGSSTAGPPGVTPPASGTSPTGSTPGSGTGATGTGTGATGTTGPAGTCSVGALQPAVEAGLGSGPLTSATIAVSECNGSYARVFVKPAGGTAETEQVFLWAPGGRWATLASGSGITCDAAAPPTPVALEDACLALELRPTLGTYTDIVTRQAVADGLALPAGSNDFRCTSWHGGVLAGAILVCRPDPEPTEGQFPILTVLVLNDRALVAWAQAGVENPGLDPDGLRARAPAGLNCTQLLADPNVHTMTTNLDDRATYFAALEYWFMEGRPARMDADSNGIPCETRFDAAVVRAVWAGGHIT